MRILLTQAEQARIRQALQRVAPGAEIDPAAWVAQHSEDVLAALEAIASAPWAINGILSLLKLGRGVADKGK